MRPRRDGGASGRVAGPLLGAWVRSNALPHRGFGFGSRWSSESTSTPTRTSDPPLWAAGGAMSVRSPTPGAGRGRAAGNWWLGLVDWTATGRRLVPSDASASHDVELDPVDERVVVDRPGVGRAVTQCLEVGLAGGAHVVIGHGREGHDLHRVD